MIVSFSSPTDEPYGCLHPAARYRGAFREDGVYWSTVAQYCLAQKLVNPADREVVRIKARDPEHADELARSMARLPDADAKALEIMRHALQASCEENLSLRAVLVSTGDAIIEARLADAVWGTGGDGHGQNLLGRALMDVRAIVRERANDPAAIQCKHQDAERAREICEHRLFGLSKMEGFHRRFTGIGSDYELLCEACCAALPAPPPLRKICEECFENYVAGNRLADLGAPAFRERASTLAFSHRTLRLFADGVDAVAFAPIAHEPHAWLMLDRSGRLHRVDTEHARSEAAGCIDLTAVDISASIELLVAPRGTLAVVAETKGRRGIVVEPASGRTTLALLRDDYHPAQCRFPLGFFEHEGRLLLVHATAWNRLDVSDPHTGELLTARTGTSYSSGEPRPPHYLDYFHAGLVVSPDGTRVIDNGWIWHPYGQVRVFSLTRWMQGNPWESEDGPSVKALCARSYFWDGPVTWLDATTLAVWGEGEDDETLTPAALVYDADTGTLLRRFAGPAQGFASVPPHLVAFEDQQGTSVWDPATGERLLHDPSFVPVAAHPTSHELLSRCPDGELRVSILSS